MKVELKEYLSFPQMVSSTFLYTYFPLIYLQMIFSWLATDYCVLAVILQPVFKLFK